jgi:hypothetical protein
MKCLGSLGCLSRLILGFVLSAVVAFSADAQIQQAWAAHYDNGITNGTNQAVKMALDSSGNIYVTGFSQNTNNNMGYVTIKYAPNGAQLWAARYDSTNYPTATPSALALDSSNNAIVTGSALTVKYDTNGNQLWTAPYGGTALTVFGGIYIHVYNGTALAVDAGANVYVTGYGTNFNTVKLNPQGSNVWFTTYADVGPTLSQVVLVDSQSNIWVAGSDTYTYYGQGGRTEGFYEQLAVVKYDNNGKQLWSTTYNPGGPVGQVQVQGAAFDALANLYLVCGFSGVYLEYGTFKYSSSGNLIWSVSPSDDVNDLAQGLAVDKNGDSVVTGKCFAYDFQTAAYGYGTFKLDINGNEVWTNYYPKTPLGDSAATSIAVDTGNNCYVTGYSPGTNGTNNIVTIKYDQNGNQIWLQRYNGSGNGNDVGNAIAVDKNGNVYVTGYETLPGGGTGIVTIKYIPVSLQRRSDGTVLLEVQGSPGESFDIQASSDLQSWFDLGTVLADTNGLMQFDDTNAPNFPARFYVPKPQ